MSDDDQSIGLDGETKGYIKALVQEAVGQTNKSLMDLAGTTAHLASQVKSMYEVKHVQPVNDLAVTAALYMIRGKSPGDVDADKLADKAFEVATAIHSRCLIMESEQRKKQPEVAQGARISGKTFSAEGGSVQIGADGKVRQGKPKPKEDADGGGSDHSGKKPPAPASGD